MKSITQPDLGCQPINLNDPASVIRWCSHFDCDEACLRKSVLYAGTSADMIRKYLTCRCVTHPECGTCDVRCQKDSG
ncbi:DUF3606 domain-containing protein [Marinobacterium sp. AK62]|uniref:DUF3606 domain-containing protein n=1 Tax=Marinobacterium alkalitolerans TaxID=1542925 RepID=A0ABS3ZED5_9GAMM|nr:DUF3606 domain-containing protein [Marinobacterium alkalitolerans]